MRIPKGLVVPLVMLVIVMVAGVAYSVSIFTRTTTITVSEPLQVQNQSVHLDAWAGGTTTYDVTVCNLANFPIPVKFKSIVTSVPPANPTATPPLPAGDPADITLFASQDHITQITDTTPLVIPATSQSGTGCVTIHVDVTIASKAIPGDYTVDNTVTKSN